MVELGIDGISDAEQIGRGGSATVFRARQEKLDRDVAVKVLHSAWDETVQRRFERERQAMGQLSLEEGILTVYEVGTTSDGAPYIVMPFIEAGSLWDLVQAQGPLEWAQATELIIKVGRAIAVAHDAGVIHRDLKPANVLMLDPSTPVITDFGLARLATSETASQSAVASFTPAYSAPESLDPNKPTTELDVYGLGACLWSLIAGHPPFSATSEKQTVSALLRRVLQDAPGDLRNSAPTELCQVIEKAMSKDPVDRQGDARIFVRELQDVLENSSRIPAGSSVATDLDDDMTVRAGSVQNILEDPAEPFDTATMLRPTGSTVEPDDSAPRWRRGLVGVAALLVLLMTAGAAMAFMGSDDSKTDAAFSVVFRDPADPSAQRGTVNGISFVSRDPETGAFLDGSGNVVAPGDTPLANIQYLEPPSKAIRAANPEVEFPPLGPALDEPTSSDDDEASPVDVEIAPTKTDDGTTDGNTDPAPVISGLKGSSVGTTSARAVFTTNTCTTATYSGSIGSHTSPGWPDANARCWTDHGTTFTGLQPDTTYSVTVEVRDKQGRSTSKSVNITTEKGDGTTPPAPVISGLSAAVTETTARVTFTTNTCTTATYSGSIGSHTSPGWPDANVRCWTSHETTFTGLQPGTTYSVSVEVRDKQGRSATKSLSVKTDGGGGTVPIVISGLSGAGVTETSAQVVFSTNTCTTATYSGSIGSHTSPGWPDANARCWTSHGTTFTGLNPGQTYSVTVEVRDKQGRAATKSLSVTTKAAPVPEPEPEPEPEPVPDE